MGNGKRCCFFYLDMPLVIARFVYTLLVNVKFICIYSRLKAMYIQTLPYFIIYFGLTLSLFFRLDFNSAV